MTDSATLYHPYESWLFIILTAKAFYWWTSVCAAYHDFVLLIGFIKFIKHASNAHVSPYLIIFQKCKCIYFQGEIYKIAYNYILIQINNTEFLIYFGV